MTTTKIVGLNYTSRTLHGSKHNKCILNKALLARFALRLQILFRLKHDLLFFRVYFNINVCAFYFIICIGIFGSQTLTF